MRDEAAGAAEPERGPRAPGDAPRLGSGDHLAQLFFTGAGGSVGGYTPHRTTLELAGVDAATDHVVYLHEVHHGGLNDSTAWGTALHLYARLPEPYRHRFLPLLDACRLPHEAYATFAGVSVAAARHATAAAALVRYPMYVDLYEALATLVAPAAGPHRRYMAATALARLAMQTPILELMDTPSLAVSPSDVREIDTPNGRWRWLRRSGDALIAHALAAADAAVRETDGAAALEADVGGADPLLAAGDAFDQVWETWERVAYAELASALAAAGATPLEFNGHLEPTAVLIDRAHEIEPRLGLAAQLRMPARDERELSAAVTDQVRLSVAERWPAALADLPPVELVATADETSRIAGRPSLLIDARLPPRLLELYRWSDTAAERLRQSTTPIVAVRTIADDGSGGSLILHTPLDTPEQLADLHERWDERGPLASIVAASCLIDRHWQERWSTPLRAIGPSLMLIDIELERFVRSWAAPNVAVTAGLVEVTDTAGGHWALAISASNQPLLWLALTDEITARLLLDQLQRTEAVHLTHRTDHIAEWSELLPIVLTHLLATESFFDFEGVKGMA